MFEYMTVQEAAKLWAISERRVQILCSENRIEGVVHLSRIWLIPKDAEKPMDKRYKSFKSRIDAEQKALTEQGEIVYEKNSDC